jgi:hypothetical protein
MKINPDLHVFARARYLKERAWLDEMTRCIEEPETAIGLAILLLHEMGAEGRRIQQEIQNIRAELGLQKWKDESDMIMNAAQCGG